MHEGQVIATQRLGKLPKKATHCHPIDENCTHLVTQLSYTKLLTGMSEGRMGGRGPWPLRFGRHRKENNSVQN